MYRGWTQVAFGGEIGDEVTPIDLLGRRLIAVRSGVSGAEVRVYDGTCPHRGAHLGHGGRLDGDAVICPFHAHRIRLGGDDQSPLRVRQVHAAHPPYGLFVLPDPALDTGLADYLHRLAASHHVVEGFSLPVPVPPEYVIENVFDCDHFTAVHGLRRRPRLELGEEPGGGLRIDGDLDMARPNQWMVGAQPDRAARVRFCARVFSPTVVASELGEHDEADVVITAATPTGERGCLVRVTVALPRRRRAGPPTVREVASLVSGSRTAFEQDAAVWRHLDTAAPPHYVEGDQLVQGYRDWCRRFTGTPDVVTS